MTLNILKTCCHYKLGETIIRQTGCAYFNFCQVRHKNTTLDPKWRRFRGAKVIKMKLPDFEELNTPMEDLTAEQVRTKLKEAGVDPVYNHRERPMYISATGGVFEAYVPPEGDGKVSKITKEGAKQTWDFLEKKGKSMLAVRKIRGFDEDFEFVDFLPQAQEIYIKAHEAMAKHDKDGLMQYVTEKAYPEALHNIERKTINWKFVKSIEPPRVVHARCTSIVTKENMFAQLTVRFHTQQILTVYDRFGRLQHGSEILAKDVLEYVVFEKHLSNRYGIWRIHDKIIPNWKPPLEPSITTYRLPPAEPSPDQSSAVSTISKEIKPVNPDSTLAVA